jgi:hypothetical protein
LDLPKAKLTRDNLREVTVLFAYLRPYRGWLLAACGALILSSLLSLCFPFLAGSLMDAAVPGTHAQGPRWLPRQINVVALVMLGILVVQSASSYFHSTTLTRVGQSALADLRRDTYARLICLPMTFFGQRRVGELNSRLAADLTQIESTLIMVVPQFLRQTRDYSHREHVGAANPHHAERGAAGDCAGGRVRAQAAPEFPGRAGQARRDRYDRGGDAARNFQRQGVRQRIV